MGMWEILEEGRDDYGRGFGMRGDEVEEAYKEGCRKGYEKAMREMRGEMGFRDGGRSYSGGGSSSGMDERRYPGYFPEYPRMDDMGERYQYDDLDESQPRISERRGRSAYTGRYVRR